jgi:tetratricopeptide (TPR) repeat protein
MRIGGYPNMRNTLNLRYSIGQPAKHGKGILRSQPMALIVASLILLAQALSSESGMAQSIRGEDRKYNSSSPAVNHLTLGLDLLKAGKPDDLYYARQNFLFIINMQDDRGLKPEAYMNLGVVETLEGNPDAATKYFYEAIKLRTEYPEAYFNLGGVFYKQGLLKKAEEAFLKAIELQSDYGRAHYSLGFVYLDQKKYDLAREHAQKAADYGVSFRTLKERLAKVKQ